MKKIGLGEWRSEANERKTSNQKTIARPWLEWPSVLPGQPAQLLQEPLRSANKTCLLLHAQEPETYALAGPPQIARLRRPVARCRRPVDALRAACIAFAMIHRNCDLSCLLLCAQEAEIYAHSLTTVNELEAAFGALWTQCQRCQGSLHQVHVLTPPHPGCTADKQS